MYIFTGLTLSFNSRNQTYSLYAGNRIYYVNLRNLKSNMLRNFRN